MEVAQDQAQPERLAPIVRAEQLDREPQPKIGVAAAMERRGVETDRGEQMRAAMSSNAERQTLWQQLREWGAQSKTLGLGCDIQQSLHQGQRANPGYGISLGRGN